MLAAAIFRTILSMNWRRIQKETSLSSTSDQRERGGDSQCRFLFLVAVGDVEVMDATQSERQLQAAFRHPWQQTTEET